MFVVVLVKVGITGGHSIADAGTGMKLGVGAWTEKSGFGAVMPNGGAGSGTGDSSFTRSTIVGGERVVSESRADVIACGAIATVARPVRLFVRLKGNSGELSLLQRLSDLSVSACWRLRLPSTGRFLCG